MALSLTIVLGLAAATTARNATWTNYRALRTLAAAHAEASQFEEAIRWQGESVDHAPPEARAEMSSLLQLYQQHRPYRQE